MRQSGKFDFSISKQGGIRLDFSVYSPTVDSQSGKQKFTVT